MRTTVELDDDVARAIADLRRERGVGVSEAVNELVRRALLPRRERPAFRQRTRRLGIRLDVSDISATLEDLEGPANR